MKNKIEKNELVMEIYFHLKDFDIKSEKFINPRYIIKYITSTPINMDKILYTNNDTIENKIALLNAKFDNMLKSFEISAQEEKPKIFKKILKYLEEKDENIKARE